MATVVLRVIMFYQSLTAQHIKQARSLLMAEWGITSKVQSLVTDNITNVIYLIVKRALVQIPMYVCSQQSRKNFQIILYIQGQGQTWQDLGLDG